MLAIIAGMGLIVAIAAWFTEPAKYGTWGKLGVVVCIPVLIVSIVLAGSIGQVDAGSRGVILQMGKVTGTVKGEGFYFKLPFIQSVVQMSVQTIAYEAEADAASNDLQDVYTTVTLNYKLDSSKVADVYQTLRKDYEMRIVKPAIQESVKAVTANFNASDLITKRPDVKAKIESSLRERLAVHGILIDTLSITNFNFSETFNVSIEAKVTAAQKAQEAENKLLQVRVEAEQVKVKAEGEAQAAIAMANGNKLAAITNAEGQAQAIRIVADQQAAANEVLNSSLTDILIRYGLVNKLGEDIKVIVLPAGQDFILGSDVLGTAANIAPVK